MAAVARLKTAGNNPQPTRADEASIESLFYNIKDIVGIGVSHLAIMGP